LGKIKDRENRKEGTRGVKYEDDRTIHEGIIEGGEQRGAEKTESMHRSARLKVDFA